MVQKIYSEMHPTSSCINMHYDVTDLVNYGLVKKAKPWVPRERNVTFL